MSIRSILVGLDGSAQSQWAAELCWQFAVKQDVTVSAQHVVNANGLLELLGFQLAGFVGSGPFLFAYEEMLKNLQKLGEELLEAYEVHASPRGIVGEQFLDQGHPIAEIRKRGDSYDLIALGHKASGIQCETDDRRHWPRLSITEALASISERPLLLVQEQLANIKSVTVILPCQHLFPNALAGARALADSISCDLRIYFWPQAEMDLAQIELQIEIYALQDDQARTAEICVEEELHNGGSSMWPKNCLMEDTLMLMPTKNGSAIRESAFGCPADKLVRYFPGKSLVLWPEEFSLQSA
jgi:nucleotide-binding universal stress UspA family protein